jgi:hypothetical protein
MFSKWKRYFRNRRQAKEQAEVRCLLAKGNKDELIRVLEIANRPNFIPSHLLDALIETNPTAIAVEIIVEFHRSERMYLTSYLKQLRDMVTDPALLAMVNQTIQEQDEKIRQALKERARIQKETDDAARNERARRSAIRRCPKCGENPNTRVVSMDVDDGWVTHHWKVCTTCGSKIVDGNGQVVSTATQMGQGEPTDW